MSLRNDLSAELVRLNGLHSDPPTTVSLTAPSGELLSIDFVVVDMMGCSFRQIELEVPAMNGAAFDALKKWAKSLSQRITYLLENIGPLEYDPDGGEVLIRSTPPDQLPDGAQYYEMLLQSHSGGRFSFRRYHSIKGQSGRHQVDVMTTHEVLLKLADDLVDTVPVSTP